MNLVDFYPGNLSGPNCLLLVLSPHQLTI